MTNPPQPNKPQYPIIALNLFPVYASRAAYQQTTGKQAPPFDPHAPIKKWLDPSPLSGDYQVCDTAPSALGKLTALHLTTFVAGNVNLPGAYIYTPYVSAPTDAHEISPTGVMTTIASADQVCMLADAQEIAGEVQQFFRGITPKIAELDAPFKYLYGVDPRRRWAITFGNFTFTAQTLIELKNYHGINSPGHWTWDGHGKMDWAYDAPVIVAPPNATIMQVPIRPLLSNEKIVLVPGATPFYPAQWIVERIDMPQPQAVETVDQQFTEVKSMLATIGGKIDALAAKS